MGRVEWLGSSSPSSALGQAGGLRAFPIGAPSTFSRAFSASHRGTDIFSTENAPIVAVESGSVKSDDDPLGGLVLYLRADSGWKYYYAHLSGFEGSYPRRVAAGDLLGYMGNTGNASSGPQHLHFQMTDPQGEAVDPYGYLLQARQGGARRRFPWLVAGVALAFGYWYLRGRG